MLYRNLQILAAEINKFKNNLSNRFMQDIAPGNNQFKF